MAVVISEDACIGCAACVSACPVESLSMVNDKAVVDDNCIDCGACIDECPTEAITL